MLRKIAVFLKPYRKECILGPVFKLLEAVLELLLPTVVALIINKGVALKDPGYVVRMGGLMLLMTLLGFACSMVCQYYAARASQGFGTILRNTLFGHISTFSYKELDRFGTSSLINRITSDVNQLQLAVAMLIRLVVRAPFICIGAIVMSMILDFRLSLILLAATPVFGIILYFIIARSSPLYRLYQRKLDRIAKILGENLSGVRVIRAFAKRDTEGRRFNAAADELTDTAIQVGRISALLSPLTSLVVNASIIVILWAGSLHIEAGRLSQGEIIAFVNYITQILLALIVVSNLVILFTKASSSARRVHEVLTTMTSVLDVPDVPDAVRPAQAAEAAVYRSSMVTYTSDSHPSEPFIIFDRVSFRYNAAGDTVLDDLSVVINRGETVGIIGGTGAGKSTFINLIPRFYDATAGEVRIGGRNVKDYPLLQLRQKIAVVPQKAVLFTGTVAENIRWGHAGATDEAVARAAAIAQADEFIAKLPQGMDTLLSRGGLNLSGGQKQRLTIARAIVAQPEILILDDSSSALDYATDASLRKALKEVSKQMTVLIVSQRVNTIRHADKIIVLDEGRIAGVGTHDQLLAGCGVYQEICQSQLDKEAVGQ